MSSVTSLLDAFRTAADVIKSVAETPGINMLPYATTLANAIRVLQAADAAGVKIAAAVQALQQTFEDGVPPQETLDALDEHIAELEELVDAVLPPKEEGEED
jgi:hypothetical protein